MASDPKGSSVHYRLWCDTISQVILDDIMESQTQA